jgi:RNA polymerase sigma-70 factor (ECF subfamily)
MRLKPQDCALAADSPQDVPDTTGKATELKAMDEAAFRLCHERTARLLFGYLLRVSCNRDLADDLLQESYCRFLATALPAMNDGEAKSYLFRIATNLLHDRWRRREEANASLADEPAREQHLDTRTDVRRAFDQLKARERELLWLAYVEGSSHKEIAELTGLRAGSIRLLLFRARRKLADLLRSRTP